MGILCLFLSISVLTPSCTKEKIETTEHSESSQIEGVIAAAKSASSFLEISNDDDDITTIQVNEADTQPAVGVTTTITNVNNSTIIYSTVSDSNGLATLGEVIEGDYLLVITYNSVILYQETVTSIGRNDYEVELSE